ncbi:NAD(P)H-binding protein [Phytoactinopolyspora endophytica]|uniref:NAD(P)H-binding protein n=1 Tax=Phytoactinopolyspora endophytica TaxID=1642495 RepID=UPI00101E0CD6|nr:NAD(P)H-binding protein [Phytoactinopolyspora endophytica]
MSQSGTILVTGATGNVGRHVVAELLDAGTDVRVMTRNPDTARFPAGVEVVRGDMTEPDTLGTAFEGVDAVFLLWPHFSADGAPAVVDAIAKHARRIVYLSAMAGGDGARPDGFWGEVEVLIERSGLEWTFIRAGGFATNLLGWAEAIRTDGVVRWPYGEAGRSLIHEADIAAVSVKALLEDRHVGAAYALTGPEVVTQAEQVRIIGEAIGREVRWEELSPEEARMQLLAEWGDEGYVEMALSAWANMVDNPEPVTYTVEEVTGTPARTFRQWAIDHAAAFRPR